MPVGANMDPISHTVPTWLSIPDCFSISSLCTAHGRVLIQWAAISPLRVVTLHECSGPISNTWFLGAIRVYILNGISVASAVFCKAHDRDRQTHRPTDRQTTSTPSITTGRIYAAYAVGLLCGVEQRAPPIFGRAAITLGIGHILVTNLMTSFFFSVGILRCGLKWMQHRSFEKQNTTITETMTPPIAYKLAET